MSLDTTPHHDWSIGRFTRWKRRLITIPAAVLAAVFLWGLSPLLLFAAFVADLAEGWKRKRWLRVLGFTLTFLLLEMIAIVVAFALWVFSGFGYFLDRDWAQRPHLAMKLWWASRILHNVTFYMSTDVHIDGDDVVEPGPLVTLARHVSMGDAVIPVEVLGKRHGLKMRYVLKDDLAYVPALDIYGHRLPTYFVDRNPKNRENELELIGEQAAGIDADSSGVIFPEGTFRTPQRFERSVSRIARSDPERAERVSRLEHLLPARHGGTLAMLNGAPDADVLVIAHIGFEKFHSFKEILDHMPFDTDVHVGVWRIDRAEIPTDEADQIVWLDEQWQRMDDWITQRTEQYVDR